MSEFVLKVDPADRLGFVSKKLGEDPITLSLKIQNPTKEKYAIKVKCTSNELFRIRPPVHIVKPNDTVPISLVFNAGKSVPDSGHHYFVVYYIKAVDDRPARALWAEHTGEPLGSKRLYVDFKKGDEKAKAEKDEKKDEKEEAKKEEKKEDEKKDDEKKDEKKEDKKEDEKKDEKEEEKKDDEKKEE